MSTRSGPRRRSGATGPASLRTDSPSPSSDARAGQAVSAPRAPAERPHASVAPSSRDSQSGTFPVRDCASHAHRPPACPRARPSGEAVAQSPAEIAGSVLRGRCERHRPRYAGAGRRDVGALNCPGAAFRERAASFPNRLCASASRDRDNAQCACMGRFRFRPKRVALDRFGTGQR